MVGKDDLKHSVDNIYHEIREMSGLIDAIQRIQQNLRSQTAFMEAEMKAFSGWVDRNHSDLVG